MIKILFTGGGTGGHLYPIIAVARAVREAAKKNNIPVELVFAGSADFDLDVLRRENIMVFRVPAGKLRRYFSLRAPWDMIKAFVGFFYALFLVWWIMPEVIFAKGGYGAINVAFAGRLYFIPLMAHESDTLPGLSNRLLGRIASRIAVSFPSALTFFTESKRAFIGNPVRESLFNHSEEKGRSLFSLRGDHPLIFIMGGSQGSRRINEVVAEILRDLLKNYEIIHQCGLRNADEFSNELKTVYNIDPSNETYYHLKGFLNEEEYTAALKEADVVISRAGAGSIYEIAAVSKPSLLIPLSGAAFDHQRENAFYYAKTGAAVVIDEANLTPHILLSGIKGIIESKERQEKMSKAAGEFAKPDAARKIAEGLLELALS